MTSKFSHLIDVDDPVRVLEGRYVGRVGQVLDILFHGTQIIVDISGMEVSYSRDQLEPLFDLERGIQLKYQQEQTPALVNAVIPFGMSSDDLVEKSAEYIAACVGRIKGVGNEQYDKGTHQQFEEMELDDLFVYAEEELQDLSNYIVFLSIRLNRLRNAIYAVDDLGDDSTGECDADGLEADDFKEVE